jgi:hypothetical protein
MEKYKDIPWYEELYQVSNLGNVKSFYSWRILKSDNSQWYSKIVLYKDRKWKTFTVHKIVMLTFIWDRLKWIEINHKDKNKSNNKLDNLEYVTHLENEKHKVEFEWFICPSIAKRKSISQYTLDWTYLRSYISTREAQRNTLISSSHIIKSCKWYKWYSYIWWYSWKYKNDNENIFIWQYLKLPEKRHFRKIFLQINTNWTIVKEWRWRDLICKELWYKWPCISNAILKQTLYHWYFWKLKKD